MEHSQHVQCVCFTEVKLDFCYTCYWVRVGKDSMLIAHSMTNYCCVHNYLF